MTVDQAVLDTMDAEFDDLKKKFGIERRTQIGTEEGDLSDIWT